MNTSSRMSSDPPLSGLKVELTIHRASNLLAADRNFMGKRSSSDPYAVILWKGQKLGKTPVIKKTLTPRWEYSVKRMLNGEDGELVRNAVSASSKMLQRSFSFDVLLFDHDSSSSDDPLGQVTVPIPYNGFDARWIPIESGSPGSKHYCKKAQGEVQLSIKVMPILLPSIVKGNVVPLKMPTKKKLLRIGLGWDVPRNQTPTDLDVSCVAVSRAGKVVIEESVYFANLQNPNKSIIHSGDEREGSKHVSENSDDREQITMDLATLPQNILAYVLLVTVATPEVDFSQVTSARVRVSDATSGVGLCAFRPAYEGANTALFLLRICRKKGVLNREGGWSLETIGETDRTARDFGSLIPEIKGYCRDLIPNLDIDPNERIAILNKGVTVRVRDYTPTRDVIPPVLTMGLAWDVTNGVNIDLDASAVCLDANLRVIDLIFFNHLRSEDGAIYHSGDEREGDEVGDDEKIIVALNGVDPRVDHIVFMINSYSGQELDDVAMASCHLFDPQTRKDLASYTLTNNKALDKYTALMVADIYKDASTREWMLRILSEPTQGKSAKRCVDAIANFLSGSPPTVAAIPPNPQVVMTEMPVAVALEEEVSFAPLDDDIVVTPLNAPQRRRG